MIGVISIFCGAATIFIFGYYVSRWGTFVDVKKPAIEDFEKRNKQFYNVFWTLYPKFRRKYRNNLPKFMLYFLAERGYINIDVDANNVVRLVKNPVSYERVPTAERFLLGILFGDEKLIEYVDESAIIGQESVKLTNISNHYNAMIETCPFNESVKKPVATSSGSKAIDYVTIRNESKIYKYCVIGMMFFSYLPSSIIEGFDSSLIAIIIAFFGVVAFFAILVSLSLKYLSELIGVNAKVTPPEIDIINTKPTPPSDLAENVAASDDSSQNSTTEVIYETVTSYETKIGNASVPVPRDLKSFVQFFSLRTLQLICEENDRFIIASFIKVVRLIFWFMVGLTSAIMLLAFLSVTGIHSTRMLCAFGSILVCIAWLAKCTRRTNKEKFFSTRRKANISYRKFFKNAFKPKMLSMYESKPKTLSYLIPYSALFNKSDVLNAALPNSPDSIPKWVTTANDMRFEEIDHLVDNGLKNQPVLK